MRRAFWHEDEQHGNAKNRMHALANTVLEDGLKERNWLMHSTLFEAKPFSHTVLLVPKDLRKWQGHAGPEKFFGD